MNFKKVYTNFLSLYLQRTPFSVHNVFFLCKRLREEVIKFEGRLTDFIDFWSPAFYPILFSLTLLFYPISGCYISPVWMSMTSDFSWCIINNCWMRFYIIKRIWKKEREKAMSKESMFFCDCISAWDTFIASLSGVCVCVPYTSRAECWC